MKSIRSSLLIRLSVVMGVLFIASGAAIYSGVRAGMIGNVDDQLRLASIGARELLTPDRKFPRPAKADRMGKRWSEFEQEGSGLYFQAWDQQGEPVARSESLGETVLPNPGKAEKTDRFYTLELADGRQLRAVLFAINPQLKRPATEIERAEKPRSVVVAKELDEVHHTLSLLLGGIAACGVFVAIGGWLMISRGLRLGLAPLSRLGEKAATIHAESLASRFEESTLPDELQPIGQRLNDLMVRLEQGFDRERRFSADLAHEMRTPIAELRAVAETALRWPDQATPADFQGILETSRRMQSLVEKLLALARWESRPTLDQSDILIPELIDDCWAPHEKTASARGITLHRTLPPDLIWRSDVGMLRPIFENLLSNAAEYTPEGGKIELAADADGLSISNPAGRLTSAQLPLLFDRCWRLDPARSDTSHFGLGLPLAKACALALGCTLTASLEGGILRFELKSAEKSLRP
jgi:signal transduction histidine kinase